jgi:hypothetical protein
VRVVIVNVEISFANEMIAAFAGLIKAIPLLVNPWCNQSFNMELRLFNAFFSFFCQHFVTFTKPQQS